MNQKNSITRGKVLKAAFKLIEQSPFDGPEWCGKFILKVLHNAGLATDLVYVEDGGTGAMVCSKLELVRAPMPGDIVKFTVHYGIFVGMTYSGYLHNGLRLSTLTKDIDVVSIDGGSFNDRVYMARREMHVKTEFYSIERLIENGNQSFESIS